MAIRNILLETDELLRKNSRPITEFNEKLWQLIDDMAETMYNAQGVGLAAVQVGVLRQVVVVDTGENLYELINPEIIEESGSQTGSEGCLSSPDEYGEVTRPMNVKVRAQDRYGREYIAQGSELLARAFCHEVDHLHGVLFKDLASQMLETKEKPKRKFGRNK